MIPLKWSYKNLKEKRGKREEDKIGGKKGNKIEEGIPNRFGFEPVRYQMQTNMIGRVMNGYVCSGCRK